MASDLSGGQWSVPTSGRRARSKLALMLLPALACGEPGVGSSDGSETATEPPDTEETWEPDWDMGSTPDLPEETPPYVIDPEPHEDWDLSPYTGWTRAHHEAVFGRLCHGVFSNLSEGGARAELGYGSDPMPDGLEGIARTLLAVGYWLENPDNAGVIDWNGHEMDLVELSSRALRNGTDPVHPEYWGPILDHQQSVVEAAWIAEFLIRSEARVWAQLDEAERDQIMAWLRPAEKRYDTNWALFEAMRDVARRKLGYSTTPGELEESLDEIESRYTGDGWYEDGSDHRWDWYGAFVIHPLLLGWAHWLGEDDEARRDRIRARAAAFLHHFPYFFGADGAPVAFGRSLAYRSAILSALQQATVDGSSPLSPGQARRLSSGNLEFHAGSPTATDRMFADDDILQLGFVSVEDPVVEVYINVGSLYFVGRGLQALSLGPEHPFWTAEELPLPADVGRSWHPVPAISASLLGQPGDGVRMHSVETHKDVDEYAGAYSRLAYGSSFFFTSTRYGAPYGYDERVTTSAFRSFTQFAAQAETAQVVPGGSYRAYRLKPEDLLVWFADDEIRTVTLGRRSTTADPIEARLSCVLPSSDAPTEVYAGGTAIGSDTEPPISENGQLWALVESDQGASMIAGLHGFEASGPHLGIAPESLTHALTAHTAFPSLRSEQTWDERCYLSASARSTEGLDVEDLLAQIVQSDVDELAQQAMVAFENGDEWWMTARAEPEPVSQQLGDLTFEGPLRAGYANADGAFGASPVERIAGPNMEIELASPGFVSCEPPLEGCRECRVNRAAHFAFPELMQASGLGVTGEWIAIEGAWDPDQQRLEIDESVLEQFGPGQELSLSTFRLCPE